MRIHKSLLSPQKFKAHKKYLTYLDDFDKDIVRRTVNDFYVSWEYPTYEKIKNFLL